MHAILANKYAKRGLFFLIAARGNSSPVVSNYDSEWIVFLTKNLKTKLKLWNRTVRQGLLRPLPHFQHLPQRFPLFPVWSVSFLTRLHTYPYTWGKAWHHPVFSNTHGITLITLCKFSLSDISEASFHASSPRGKNRKPIGQIQLTNMLRFAQAALGIFFLGGVYFLLTYNNSTGKSAHQHTTWRICTSLCGSS